MSGVSPERLSPKAVGALSHRLGNSALLELMTLRGPSQDRESCPVPGPLPEMDAAVLEEGEPDLIPAVDFAGLPPLETAAGPV